jgi:hypothetical protein
MPAKKRGKKKVVRPVSGVPSFAKILAVIEETERKLRGHKPKASRQTHKEEALRFLGNLKKKTYEYCCKDKGKDKDKDDTALINFPHKLAHPDE